MNGPAIRPAGPGDARAWTSLREALWRYDPPGTHARVVGQRTAQPGPDQLVLIARSANGRAVGLAEASVRHEPVNGCDEGPVLFLEGLFVRPAHRRRGVARALVAAVADWGRARGLTQFASDSELDNRAGQALHRALGFAETGRVVCFYQPLPAR